MNLSDVLEELSRRRVSLATNGSKLTVSAPEGALTEDVRLLIREHRPVIVQFLKEREEEEARRRVRIARADRSAPLPASYAQQRMWLMEQLGTDLPVYNMYFGYRLTGDLDVAALRGAAEDLVRRHEILRTALVQDDSGLWQRIDDDCPAVFEVHHPAPEDVDDLVFSAVATRFDLGRAPLIRFDLISSGPREWTFVVTQHHAVSDGWSAGLIRKDLSELYAARVEGRSPRLPELRVQYADYAAWERDWSGGEIAEHQRDFWRETLADLPPVLDLAAGGQRQAVQSFRGTAHLFRLGPRTREQARRLCARTGGTLYSTLLGAYSLLLSRLSGSDDVTVGSPLANRPYPALERTLGLFFNTIALRSRIDEEESVRDYLARVRRTAFDAFAHQDLPFDQVVQTVAPDRSSSHSPVFQTIFILQSYPDDDLRLPGVTAEVAAMPIYSAQFDLMFKLREDGDDFAGLLFYNDTLFTEDNARRMVAWYEDLVAAMASDPDAPVGSLPLTDAASQGDVARWNAVAARPPATESVHVTICRQLAQDPEEPAVTFRGATVTRGQLARRSAAVAFGLSRAGLLPGQRVGVLVTRSPDLVAVLLGILRAGLTYVPLDGRSPQGRLTGMLRDADCRAIVVDEHYGQWCPGFTGTRLPLADLLSGADSAEPAGQSPVPVDVPADDRPAYTIFTSGSTGVPKGVEITQANLANLFVALDDAVPVPEAAAWLAVSAVTFDIAVVELLWTLARGIPVVLAETAETLVRPAPGSPADSGPGEDMRHATVPQLILAHGVTAMQATPTLLRNVLRLPDAEQALSRLRLLLVGGEALDRDLARRLKSLGIPTLLNMYGPTETTVWSTAWTVPEDPDTVRVGRPLANTSAHVLGPGLRPLPVGFFGELVLGGAGVANGYAGDPERTAERFVHVPGLAAGPLYRTGDIARWLPDGTLEVTGRIDHQVKVGGYRIELEEVEHALNSLAGVAQSAVHVQRHDDRDILVAHYVPDGAALEAGELRDALSELLPDQMLPSVFNALPELPVTTSGKTDRGALPPVSPVESATVAAEPQDDLERRLLALWQRVLGRPGVGVADDFFRSGGNSILVARLLIEVRAEISPGAQIVDLFRYPTVRAYAAHLVRQRAGAAAGDDRAPRADGVTRQRSAQEERRQQVLRKRQARAARQPTGRPASESSS